MPSLPIDQIISINAEVQSYHQEKGVGFFWKQFIKDSPRSNIIFTQGRADVNPDEISDHDTIIVQNLPGFDLELSSPKFHELKLILDAKKATNPRYPSIQDVMQFTTQSLIAEPTKALYMNLLEHSSIGLQLQPSIGKQTSHIAILDDGYIVIKAQAKLDKITSHTHMGDDDKVKYLQFNAHGNDTNLEIEVTINPDGRFTVTDVNIPDLSNYSVGASLVEHIQIERVVHSFKQKSELDAISDAALEQILASEAQEFLAIISAHEQQKPSRLQAAVSSFTGSLYRNVGSISSLLGVTAADGQLVATSETRQLDISTMSSFEDLAQGECVGASGAGAGDSSDSPRSKG